MKLKNNCIVNKIEDTKKGRIYLKKKLLGKAVSLIAAATMSCTSVICSGAAFAASDNENTNSVEITENTESTELVTVIVKVTGDAVMTTPEGVEQGSEFLNTDEAVQMSEALESTQSHVQNEIRKLYPEMQVGYSYSVLYNGFSCDIPENLIDAIKNLPYVEDVTKSISYAVPQMTDAPSLGDIPAYYDATGCYGEGKVIAVIDSELDYTHPMFAPLDEEIEISLKPEDIAEIAAGIGFNVDIDPERAYLSSKLPYVIDYIDDPYDGIRNEDSYHGTHVSGIAAGNEFTDENGKVISGIAKNSQIVFMALGTGGLGIDTDAVLAAIEDAVKLHADVINMSFGSEGECYDDPIYDAYIAVENAGIVICNSSGNDAEGTLYGGVNRTDNPDVSTTNNIPAGTKIMTIASASNAYTAVYHTFSVDGKLIPYTETYRSDIPFVSFFMDNELQGEFEYVFCGKGTAEELEGLDLTGKIAVIEKVPFFSMDGIFPEEQAQAALAQSAGAAGIIYYIAEGKTAFPDYVDAEIPSAIIGYDEAQKMLAAENKTLVFTDETIDVDIPTSVSEFTSWGVKQCLELEPDIMGIGGHVESAAYGDSTVAMDGTSMSSPYVAGCVAVTLEYLDKQGVQLDGGDKITYIRNLLMNSAALYKDDDGLYVTPRRQGAGLVNLNNMLSDKVIMTNTDNDAKINLYDNIGDVFDFDVNLTNLSDEDVNFSSARLVLTTTDYYLDDDRQVYCISPTKQIALESSADVSALTSISAGESRTEHVSVSLNPEQTSAIKEIYTNGFFVEGYLLLEGAENCCDISIPMLGFCGDWAQLPIFGEYAPGLFNMGDFLVAAGFSMAKLTNLLREIRSQIPEKELNDENADFSTLLSTYATEEQLTALWSEEEEDYYISPNGDGLADTFGIKVNNIRFTRYCGINIYNEEGELVSEGEKADIPLKDFCWISEIQDSLSELPDGIYTAEVTGVIDYASSYENPQKITYQFIIDNNAPEIKTEISEKNGRKILKLTAADTNLDGIYITGTGNGGLYGVYDPENAPKGSLDTIYSSIDAKELKAEGVGFTYDYNTVSLPLIGKVFAGTYTDAEMADVDFTEIIVAEPNENGIFTIEYDITDFSAYSFTVMDKAYNVSEYANEVDIAESIKPGIYTDNERVFCFTENTVSSVLFQNGETSESEYTVENGKAVIDGKTVTVYPVNSRILKLVSEDGTSDILIYQGEGSLEDYHFYTTDQLKEAVVNFLEHMFLLNITKVETNMSNNMVNVAVYIDEHGKEQLAFKFRIDNTTGSYSSGSNEEMSFFPVTIDDIATGVWIEVKDGEMNYWNFDNSIVISQEDKSEHSFSYTLNNTDLTFNFDGTMKKAKIIIDNQFAATIKWEDETVSTLRFFFSSDPPEEEYFEFYSNQELCDMAVEYYTAQNGEAPEMTSASADEEGNIIIKLSETEYYVISPMICEGKDEKGEYILLVTPPEYPEDAYALEDLKYMALNDYEQKTGIRPEEASATFDEDGTVTIILGNEASVVEYYIVDPVTGEGINSSGEEVALPQTGNNTPVTAVMVSVSVFMILAGFFTVLGSGILRRKKNEE